MNAHALEEAELIEDTNEQEPQPDIAEPASTMQPEAREPETTALVPTTTEQEVIEGEVIVIEPPQATEDYALPKQKPYWLLIPFTIFLCLVFLAGSYLLPLFTPTATVTIIPVERSITTTAAILVHGRLLPALTLSQSITVSATGNRHQAATRALGTITFYNGLFTRQTIAKGAIFTASNGVQIVTTQPTIIPAGNPPSYGQVTVSAHAVIAGSQGNIQAYDINTACCATSVLAKNTEAFTGGQNAREYTIVTRADIQNAASLLQATLSQSEQAALRAQLHPDEQLFSPSCSHQIKSDHQPGDEAKQVAVTVSNTCSGTVYDAHNVYTNATQLITSEALKRLGTGYSLIGDTQVTIIHAKITDQVRGIATIVVTLDATYVYQLSPGETQRLVQRIAGKTQRQAVALLLQLPGIQAARITSTIPTLPENPGRMTIHIQYISV